MIPDKGQNGIDPSEITVEWLKTNVLNRQLDLSTVDTSRIIYPIIDLLSGIHGHREPSGTSAVFYLK